MRSNKHLTTHMKSNLKSPESNKGIIRFIILIIIAIAVLSYFGFDLRKIFESDLAKNNFAYVWNWAVYAWDNFLKAPVEYVWNTVIIGILWNLAIQPLFAMLANFAATHHN